MHPEVEELVKQAKAKLAEAADLIATAQICTAFGPRYDKLNEASASVDSAEWRLKEILEGKED